VPITQHLSPEYGLSLMRLADGTQTWPGLLLHSPTLTWPFDPHARVLDDLADVQGAAHLAGLHRVSDPFGADLPEAGEPWTFQLPTARDGQLSGAQLYVPGLAINIDRTPRITDDWWSAAVSNGGRCRMFVAACVVFPDNPADAADVLTDAATHGRVYGATIRVKF